jgi:hypothetical protein
MGRKLLLPVLSAPCCSIFRPGLQSKPRRRTSIEHALYRLMRNLLKITRCVAAVNGGRREDNGPWVSLDRSPPERGGGIPRISIPTVAYPTLCKERKGWPTHLFVALPAVPNTNRGLIENLFLLQKAAHAVLSGAAGNRGRPIFFVPRTLGKV